MVLLRSELLIVHLNLLQAGYIKPGIKISENVDTNASVVLRERRKEFERDQFRTHTRISPHIYPGCQTLSSKQ